MKNTPLVSVITAYYSGVNYIKETIESVYFQTYKDIELIIADDCSPDKASKLYIEELQKEYGSRQIRCTGF